MTTPNTTEEEKRVKQLVIFPTGTLSAKDKERMSKEGYLAVESADPSKVTMPLPSGELVTSDMVLMAALHGLSGSLCDGERSKFAIDLIRRVQAKEAK